MAETIGFGARFLARTALLDDGTDWSHAAATRNISGTIGFGRRRRGGRCRRRCLGFE
jgi:hypothetical protein